MMTDRKLVECFKTIFFWSGLEELHSLVEQAETKAFPKSSLVDQLRSITTEADKVAVMAQQLLNGKRQTRYFYFIFLNLYEK